MKRLLDVLAMSAGGWLGWALGAVVGTFTAYVVSVVGAGVGLYLARKVSRHLAP